MKRLLSLMLILPLLVYCGDKDVPGDNQNNNEEQNQEGQNGNNEEDPDLYADAAPELKNGDVVQATNPLVEKFLTEVDYADKTCKDGTKVLDYPGGFNGTDLNWDNWKKEWPDGDKPMKYSIRWKKADLDDVNNKLVLHLEDKLGWSGDLELSAGSVYAEITNLVPGDDYSYKVTSSAGKVVAQGSFKTKNGCSLHQVFFTGASKKVEAKQKGSGVRNVRDLGGWPTLDGKKTKYRKFYRGGRMNDPWETMLNKQGKTEVLFEGIGAQIDLRGSDDVVKTAAVNGLDHCAPVIEEGGKVMLGVTKPSNKNCAKWLKYDQGRTDISDVSSYTPTPEELEAFQVAYRGKTKQLFEFCVNSLRNNKPVYFHCSLGRDRTGTLDIILLGVLGVREGIIAKEYEVTYWAPVGYSVSSSDQASNPEPIFKNTRAAWVYSDIVPYFWELAQQTSGKTFAEGVEKYLRDIAGVAQKDIDDFRSLMLE
ncbi:MAG: tyrosine-protein phosphatase [Bacteroidales bacterium]|nr:tyrosine-protein phosphatase [Bacteroidales bacterium]